MKNKFFLLVLGITLLTSQSVWGIIPSEYCTTEISETLKGGKNIALTWVTLENGDVQITMSPGTGATSCAFRNGGFEGGIGAFVVSTDNFTTTTPASNYFTFEKVYSGTVATLVKIAELPANAKIKHIGSGHALAWTVDGNGEYCFPDLIYTYGGVCSNEPASVQLDCSSLNLPKGKTATLKASILPASADQSVNWSTSDASKVTVSSTGVVEGKAIGEAIITATSSVNEELFANCTISVYKAPASEYCAKSYSSGNTEAKFTWETDAKGNVIITLLEPDETVTAKTYFRGSGVNIGSLKVGNENASNYFTSNVSTSSNVQTLSLKGSAPAAGSKLTYNAVVEYAVVKDNNAWPTLQFEYTYGGVCTNELEVRLDQSATTIAVGKTRTLSASILPAGSSQDVTWSSDNETIASVDANGVITAKTAGTTVIKAAAKADPTVFATCSVTVVAPIPVDRSEYCNFTCEQNRWNTRYAAITWETEANGDVLVTASAGAGCTNVIFRNGGFEGGINAFKVSSDNFQTQEDASKYFTFTNTEDGPTTRLINIKYLPEGTKIKYDANAAVLWNIDGEGGLWSKREYVYTYGSICSGYVVSATSSNETMGSALVKQNGEIVEHVDEDTEVDFIATANDTYRFVNWTKAGVVVSTDATYNTTITEQTDLVANFDYIRDPYCHYEVQATNVAKKLYLTMAATGTANQYMIRIEGSSEAQLTSIKTAAFKLNNITVGWTEAHTDVEFTAERWTFDPTGYGTATITFALQEGKTLSDLYVWQRNILFATADGDVSYTPDDSKYPNRYRIGWDETCADTEAPVLTAPTAAAINATSVRLTLSATDNWDKLIYYTIQREGAADVETTGASGVTITTDIKGLTPNIEYTFSVTASDGTNVSAAQQVSITPTGDAQAPTDVTIVATPVSMSKIQLSLFANDDYAGNITYTITSTPALTIDPIEAERGTTAKTIISGLTADTEYTFSVVASDAAGNAAEAVESSGKTYDANIALNKPSETNAMQGAGQAADRANDANEESWWTSYGQYSYSEWWWKVNLQGVYDIDNIRILFNDINGTYNVYSSLDGENWSIYAANFTMSSENKDYFYIAPVRTRFFKFTSNHADVGIKEFEAYGTQVTDTEAPIISSFAATGESETSIRATVTATDNFGLLTYTFYCDEVASEPVEAISGEEVNYTFTGLQNKEYSIYVKASDGVFTSTSETVKTYPVLDEQAPTNLAASNVVPSYDRVSFTLSAIDDKGGTITYIVKDGDTQVATADAISGTPVNIEVSDLNYLTVYNWSATAQDASGNVCDPVNIQFTTLEPPFPMVAAPTPKHYQSEVMSIFSNAYTSVVKTPFSWTSWGGPTTYVERNVGGDDYAHYVFQLHGEIGIGDKFIDVSTETVGIDVSEETVLHVDIWSLADGAINITLNDAVLASDLQLVEKTWTSFEIPLADFITAHPEDVSSLKWMKFNGCSNKTIAVDNIYFHNRPQLVIDEAEDNDDLLDENDDKLVDVTLNRTFVADGYWYTLCLPFSLTADQLAAAYGADYDLRYLESSYMKSSDMMYLSFEKATELEAGMPYMFKPTGSSNEEYAAKKFMGVVIDNKTPVQTTSYATMTGYYAPMIIDADDYALGSDDYLYHTDGTASKALRCYFTLNPPTSAPLRARCVFNDSHIVTNLKNVNVNENANGKMIIDGKLIIMRDGVKFNAQGARL